MPREFSHGNGPSRSGFERPSEKVENPLAEARAILSGEYKDPRTDKQKWEDHKKLVATQESSSDREFPFPLEQKIEAQIQQISAEINRIKELIKTNNISSNTEENPELRAYLEQLNDQLKELGGNTGQ